jgi:hypothetical protein
MKRGRRKKERKQDREGLERTEEKGGKLRRKEL